MDDSSWNKQVTIWLKECEQLTRALERMREMKDEQLARANALEDKLAARDVQITALQGANTIEVGRRRELESAASELLWHLSDSDASVPASVVLKVRNLLSIGE